MPPRTPSDRSPSSITPTPTRAAVPLHIAETAREAARAGMPKNTRRAYRADWADFTTWCSATGVAPLPAAPEAVAAYLKERSATLKTSTLARRLAAIAVAHRAAGAPSPTGTEKVKLVLKGIRARKGSRPQKKRPVESAQLERMIEAIDDPKAPLRSLRDRAMLLLGFATALRRAALADLRVEDLEWRKDRLVVLARRGKTDQEGRGHTVAVFPAQNPRYCPARGLWQWLKTANIRDGYVFRKMGRHKIDYAQPMAPAAVAGVVKRAAEAIGLDSSQFAGHSLRAGHITQAWHNAATVPEIMETTGQKAPTVYGYIREADPGHASSARKLGLGEKKR